MSKKLDIQAHLRNVNYESSVQWKRVLWMVLNLLLRFVPRWGTYELRNQLLRVLGAEIGKGVRIYPSTRIMYPWNLVIGSDVVISWNVSIYNLGRITIGDDVLISQNAHLCAGTHDISQSNLPLLTPDIVIEAESWICADAFIGPGVKVGKGCVIGARSVVICDVDDGTIVVGNPAKIIKKR